MLVVAAFVGGIHFERERQRREDLANERLEFEAESARMLAIQAELQRDLTECGARWAES